MASCSSASIGICPLLLLSTFFFSSDTSSHLQTSATFDGFNPDGWISWRRSVAEAAAPASVDGPPIQENTTFILAADRTRRRDPLDGFKYYTGGWNISERHYLASVGFTAAPYFAIAAMWFVGFGLVMLLLCCCYCCCPRSYSYSRFAYALSLILLIVFTIAAIIGSVFLYYGQSKFHDSTSATLDFVVSKANCTVENLRNFLLSLEGARNISVRQISLLPDVQNNIDLLETKITESADELDDHTRDNSKDISHVLDIMRITLIIIAAVMLLLAFLGFFFSVLGLRFPVSILVIIGWILVSGTFILSGVFLLLHNVVSDTCVAMDEWVQHPSVQTALDDILPCVDVNTANESFNQSRIVTRDLINNINSAIDIANADFPPGVSVSYNQSGPPAPLLCNPYTSDLTDRTCANGEVDLEYAPKVWNDFVCEASGDPGSQICISVGRFTPELHNQLIIATNVIFGLYSYSPFLKDVADCTFVRKTFATISTDKCPSLRRNSDWVYIGLGLVSAAVMFSLIFWVIYARERRHRKYGKQFLKD